MTARHRLLLAQGSNAWDVSDLVESVRWTGRKGSAARSLTVTLLDDDGYGRDKANIDAEQGQHFIFYWDGAELFRGLIMRHEQARQKKMSVTAYDAAIYMANNKDTFNYTGANGNKTASEIFVDCCKRFSIPYSDVAETGYKIPELPKPKTTPFDVICDALSLTYKATGVRYYPACKGASMRLMKRTDNILQWVIETGSNISDYRFTKSIEKIKTRIKLLSNEGAVLAAASDPTWESKIGIFQDINTPDDALNQAQLTELVKSILAESIVPERVLTVTALGLPEVITGIGVFVVIKELGISKTYYVEEDSHTFRGLHHSMSLKLVPAGDIEKPVGGAAAVSAEISIGDVVQFSGGSHYVSSTATTPTGGTRTAGSAKVTLIAKGASHPYHLIGGADSDVGGSSNVYGWVDASTVSK